MATVDFTTYTTVDADSDLTVTSSKIDVDTMRNDALSYVIKDYGAGYFGNFVHRFKFTFTEATEGTDPDGALGIWAITSGLNYSTVAMGAADDGIFLRAIRIGAVYSLQLRNADLGNATFYTFPSVPAVVWIQLARVGTNTNMKVYSDAYTTELASKNVYAAATAHRYHFGLCSYDGGGAADTDTVTGAIESFDPVPFLITQVGTATYANASKVGTVAVAGISKIGTVAN